MIIDPAEEDLLNNEHHIYLVRLTSIMRSRLHDRGWESDRIEQYIANIPTDHPRIAFARILSPR